MAYRISLTAFVCVSLAIANAKVAAEDVRFAAVDDSSGKPRAVELRGLSDDQLAKLKRIDGWPAVFEVRVATASDDSPPMAGEFQLSQKRIRFLPRFRFQTGLEYEATFTAAAAIGLKPTTARWKMVDDAPAEPTSVSAIYPSADTLPENQLKFYLHFTAPMARGEAYEHVQLLRENGEAIDLPFLEIGEELWDPSGKRLTLLIDPGRIKQGVKPREDIGPVLEAGNNYTLVVDERWKDAAGRPLAAGFKKTFKAAAPVAGALDTGSWKIDPIKTATRGPLRVQFPAPLDHALLQRTVWIESSEGEVTGEVHVVAQERQWVFTPKVDWGPGPYWLVVDTVLEDLGGNRIGSAFEVDALDPLQKRVEMDTVRLPLSVE